MNSLCAICKRCSRGFGWTSPVSKITRKFCSFNCQKFHSKLINSKGEIMIDVSETEKKVIKKMLPDIGNFISKNIGINKPISSYTKQEIILLINKILTVYFKNLDDEISKNINA